VHKEHDALKTKFKIINIKNNFFISLFLEKIKITFAGSSAFI